MAGGGGLLIFPTLIFAGLPAISANATATLISWPGHIVGVVAYRKELQAQLRLSCLFGSVGLVGGSLGAMLLLWIPTVTFEWLVPYLLLVAMLLFTCGEAIATRLQIEIENADPGSWLHLLKAACIQLFVAIYGGFYGLGISFLLLAELRIVGMKDINEMNALKLLSISCIYGFAAVMFVHAGIVVWPQALVMMVGTTIGGYSGARYARQLEPMWVKRFVTTVGFAMTGYFFLHK